MSDNIEYSLSISLIDPTVQLRIKKSCVKVWVGSVIYRLWKTEENGMAECNYYYISSIL